MDSREWRHRCWRTPLVVVALMLILLGVQPFLQLAWPSNHELSASLRVASHKWQTFGSFPPSHARPMISAGNLVAVNNGRMATYEYDARRPTASCATIH
jgi:hypothetical protein